MPRTPRLDYPGARHHVMNRAARRRMLFRTDADLRRFLDLLAELPGRYAVRVHGYALMGNHFHLMLEDSLGNLPDAMSYLGGDLARRTNAARGVDGPLFRARYRNRVVLDDAYWRNLLAYLHLNPVRAGLVAHPDGSGWTSHRAYAGLSPAPPWLVREELLDLYDGVEGYRAAMEALILGRAQLPDELREDRLWAVPSTSGARVARVVPTVASLSPERALAQVAALVGGPVDALLRARRGRAGHPGRTLAAWWLQRSAARSRAQVAELLGMSPLAVGASAHRVRVAREGILAVGRDRLLEAWLAPLAAIGDGMEDDVARQVDEKL